MATDVLERWRAIPEYLKVAFDGAVECLVIGPTDKFDELSRALEGLTLAAENGELRTVEAIREAILAELPGYHCRNHPVQPAGSLRSRILPSQIKALERIAKALGVELDTPAKENTDG